MGIMLILYFIFELRNEWKFEIISNSTGIFPFLGILRFATRHLQRRLDPDWRWQSWHSVNHKKPSPDQFLFSCDSTHHQMSPWNQRLQEQWVTQHQVHPSAKPILQLEVNINPKEQVSLEQSEISGKQDLKEHFGKSKRWMTRKFVPLLKITSPIDI